MTVDRKAFDEAIANMTMQASPYYKEYVFYMHLLSQCRVVFTNTLKAPAGVGFDKDHYTLYINTSPILGYGQDKNGQVIAIQGFSTEMPIEHRIGILKHEMLHIILGHLLRVGDKDFQKYNVASDCALNQQINREHLPDYAIYPDNIPTDLKQEDVLKHQTSEYYYEILKNQENEGGGNEGANGSYPSLDDHSFWETVEGDPTLQQEITKNMLEKAANEAIKSAGTLPKDYSAMLDNLLIRREVDWKQVLRAIVGNKKANSRKTLMRRDRRMPQANWIKGKTKDRIFELGVVSDVSGSVDTGALTQLWGEIISICEMFNTPVTMVQVDTAPSKPEKLTKRTKNIERTRCGGTTLAPAIQAFKDNHVNFDALVVTTDGYLFQDDISPFLALKKPIIWLIEAQGQVLPEMNQGMMKAIKLTGK